MGRSRSTPGWGRRRRRIRRLRRWAWRWRLAFTRKPPGCEPLRVVSYLDCSQKPGGFRVFGPQPVWGYACFWTREQAVDLKDAGERGIGQWHGFAARPRFARRFGDASAQVGKEQ